ncbi:MAG: hypothetical protein JW834_00985 [Candidatus Diapherotrites archaeon]|nr:hypothetical protein [Candidatus Diapherotrites archaeon]
MPTDEEFLRLAMKEAGKCAIDVNGLDDNKFTVGCVIAKDGRVISTGFTGEPPFSTHAEETAIRKCRNARGATLYCTMEPCSTRLFTGTKTCTEWILQSGIRRVVYGAKEPAIYVHCQGHRILEENGIEVKHLKSMNTECLKSIRPPANL